jgi:glycosyltransferase involved in cell wall biosynthesis
LTGRPGDAERPAILVPPWYALMIGPPCVAIEDAVRERYPAWLVAAAARFGPLRGLLIHRCARNSAVLALLKDERGTSTAVLLEALFGRRRVVLLEFLGRPRHGRRLLRMIEAVRRRLIEGPAMRRAISVGQVLTEWERWSYADAYGVPVERFRVVRWPLSRTGERSLTERRDANRAVVASGRAYTDWDTVLAAARGRDWKLTIVCGRRDLERIEARAQRLGASVMWELPREEHDDLVRRAAVYVLALREAGVSAGHVRLMAAVDAGTAVVATRSRGLAGYVTEETALLVPPCDPQALGEAVDSLLGDAAAQARMGEAAFARARTWTYEEYFRAIAQMLEEAGAGVASLDRAD